MIKIDINCDVGEGIGNEHLLMPLISSCNIACGGHFGDEQTIDKTIQLALDNHLKIGAHPSFPDKENFGRKIMQISDDELEKSLQAQLELFCNRLQKANAKLHHIKPHGALYNLIAANTQAATHFINSIKKYTKEVFLYVPYNSAIEQVALEHQIEIIYEAFADRNYTDDLLLVSRSKENALITAPKKVFEHVLSIIKNERVVTITNAEVEIKAATFCVHGDNTRALDILKEVTQLLQAQNIQIV